MFVELTAKGVPVLVNTAHVIMAEQVTANVTLLRFTPTGDDPVDYLGVDGTLTEVAAKLNGEGK